MWLRPFAARRTLQSLRVFFLLFLMCVTTWLLHAAQANAQTGDPARVLYLAMDSPLTYVEADRLEAAVQRASRERFDLLLVGLNTPGGGAQDVRRMVKLMVASPRPVVVWVGPGRGRAGGSGLLLLAAAAHVGMSSGSFLGSPAPFEIGEHTIVDDRPTSVASGSDALMRSLILTRDRPITWDAFVAGQRVELSSHAAQQHGMVDFIADTPQEALARVGAAAPWAPWSSALVAGNLALTTSSLTLEQAFLSWAFNPHIAYLLRLGGMAGLFYELMRPGSLVAGAAGTASLLVGMYAVSVLPTNVFGLLFMLLGIIFFLLEVYLASYGLLIVAGSASLFWGSVTLFNTPEGAGMLSVGIIAAAILVLSALLVLVMVLDARSRLQLAAVELAELEGSVGMVRSWSGGGGQVFVRGRIRPARFDSAGDVMAPGCQVRVLKSEGGLLMVEPMRRRGR